MERGGMLAVTPVTEPGGAEISMLRLLAALGSRGWRVTVTAPGPGRVLAAAARDGHATQALDLGGLGRHRGAAAVRSWPRARRLAQDCEVVLLNGSVTGRLLPALRGLPARTALFVHDVVDRVPRMWGTADVLLAPSGAAARALAPLEAHVVHEAVDLDPPPADPPWPAADAPVVGFVGRIEPRKAPLDLVRAAPAISAGAPGARIVLIGDGAFEGDTGYERRVLEEARAANVERYPWVDGAAGLMRHLDVLVLPSTQEPFGTVLAEAMAVGTPVVATRVGGVPEVVDDGVTGRLVSPGDPAALADAVLHVLAHREAMGEAAKGPAARFSAERQADVIEEILAAARRGSGRVAA